MSDALVQVVHSEITKLRTLRSVLITIGATVVGTVGLGYLSGSSIRGAIDSDSPLVGPGFTPEASGFDVVAYGQVGIIVLGVLAMSSEYANGQIRASLMSVPNRGLLFGGKVVALALVSGLTALPTVILSFVSTQLGLGQHGVPVTAGDVPLALAGAVIYWVLIGLLASSLTVIARNAVIPLVVLVALVLALSTLLQQVTPVARFLPDLAGSRMFDTRLLGQSALRSAGGGAVMLAWVVAFLSAGYLMLEKRDA